MISLVEKSRLKQPVLVFCKQNVAEALKQRVPAGELVSSFSSHASLDNLEKACPDGGFRVLLASSEVEMRGLDYRARKLGICLIVNRSFSSHRAMY